MAGSGNGLRPAILGSVLLALAAIFSFVNGLPWERKGAAAEVKADILRELGELRSDVRELRSGVREVRDILQGQRR